MCEDLVIGFAQLFELILKRLQVPRQMFHVPTRLWRLLNPKRSERLLLCSLPLGTPLARDTQVVCRSVPASIATHRSCLLATRKLRMPVHNSKLRRGGRKHLTTVVRASAECDPQDK